MMRLTAKDVLMLSQLPVVLPYALYIPFWLSGLTILCIISQLSFIAQRFYSPSPRLQKIIQVFVFFAGLAGVVKTFHTLLGLEAGTAFLILCLIGKLFEVKARRDAYVVLTLGLFITAGQFLFDQGLMTAIWAILATCGLLYAMMIQNQLLDNSHDIQVIKTTTNSIGFHHALKTILSMVMLAVPLMVILFIFFPRMPPLWSIHLNQDQAKTGISDSMSPGDIANLSQSTELAFRATFENGRIPSRSDLYWRGLVFSSFDGSTWRPAQDFRLKETLWGSESIPLWLMHGVALKTREPTKYEVTMEPTQQPWLFALDISIGTTVDAGLTREYHMQASDDIRQQTTYRLLKYDAQTIDANVPEWLLRDTLQLPEDGNPQSRAFAKKTFEEANRNPELYAKQVIAWIRKENFVYTLQPPPLIKNRIDQFLFTTKRGFCEHYASAFTFLMRAAGVPARVVAGYQGGQPGRDGRSLEIRQMDAHAWSEIWLEGRGWVRYDPTAAIAPERIERGMGEFTSQSPAIFGEGIAGQYRYNQFKIFGQAREWVDYAKYMWQQKVVGFDQSRQENFLFNFFGLRSQLTQVLAMFLIFSLVLAVIVSVQWWRKRPNYNPLDKPLIQLSQKLAKQGLARDPHEGVLQWLLRVGQAGYPDQTTILSKVYSAARYSHDELLDKETIKTLARIVRIWHKE